MHKHEKLKNMRCTQKHKK